MPRGSTPSGGGMKKMTAPTTSMTPNFQSMETVSFERPVGWVAWAVPTAGSERIDTAVTTILRLV
ncbi:hypothetical protein GCM10009824_00630 [Kocuria atrinae]|uniref:Uncharacterized protein n=1 Tax=Kocuria atrinae TaxID=592377 RepID=A0ABN2XC97_9MICC